MTYGDVSEPAQGSLQVQWGRENDKENYIRDIPNIGFSGDHFLRPLFVDKEWEPYESVLYVDPSGRGADETAWSIVAALNGLLYLIDCKGWAGDPTEAMTRIAMDARKYDVNLIEVEPNYGQGMWISAFQPILNDIWKRWLHSRRERVGQGTKRATDHRYARTGTDTASFSHR